MKIWNINNNVTKMGVIMKGVIIYWTYVALNVMENICWLNHIF
jgi:hypothetical protein